MDGKMGSAHDAEQDDTVAAAGNDDNRWRRGKERRWRIGNDGDNIVAELR